MKKKFFSILLAAMMVAALVVPASAATEYKATLKGELDTSVSDSVDQWGIENIPSATVKFTLGVEATISMTFDEPIKFTGNWTGIATNFPVKGADDAAASGAKITSFKVDGKELGSKALPLIDQDDKGFLTIDIARQWGEPAQDTYGLIKMAPFTSLEITFIVGEAAAPAEPEPVEDTSDDASDDAADDSADDADATDESDDAAALAVVPTAWKIFVNDEEVAFDAYNINGSNFFKIADVAFTFMDTKVGFSADLIDGVIVLKSGEAYEPTGNEMKPQAESADLAVVPTQQAITLDGNAVEVTAYNINGSNYFMMADLVKLFGFGATFDADAGEIYINTELVKEPRDTAEDAE
ncbi:MAG: hypothetical protein FWG36_06455 [Oscillospiraceae bacterium]|nr:hypothetical protein [Oscillospiraceae bacterium]